MPRISEAKLTRLKQDVAIDRLATTRGIILHPSENNLIGRLPFHEGHDPSHA